MDINRVLDPFHRVAYEWASRYQLSA